MQKRRLITILFLAFSVLAISQTPMHMLLSKKTTTACTATDADACTYLTAVSVTDPTKVSATDAFFIGLKADGLYSKMHGFGLALGSNITDYGRNAKNPGTYDWTPTNSPVAGSDGIQWAANSYMTASGWTLAANGNHNDFAMGYYSKTNVSTTTEAEMTIDDATVDQRYTIVVNYASNVVFDMPYNSGNGRVFTVNPLGNVPALYTLTSNSSTESKAYIGTSLIGTVTKVSPATSSAPLRIGGSTQTGFYSTKTCQFWFWSTSLTATDISNLNTRVQTFLTAIGR